MPTNSADLHSDLIQAAASGDLSKIEQLIAQGADVNASNSQGVTPLIAAAYQNQTAAARALIEAGADVNIKDNTQQSAYLISTSEGYLELLQMTLQAGADVHSLDSFNGTGLIRAADRGHVEIIEELLKTDINVNHVNRLGWTALLEAIILGDGGPRHTEVVRLLVDAGADVHLADGSGVTPLDHARSRGFDEIVRILEEADPSAGTTDQAAGARQETLANPADEDENQILKNHPLYNFTIPAFQERDFPGGIIEIRSLMQENESFSQSYIAYPSDGLTITGLMYEPQGDGPFPVLILLHGYYERDQYVAGSGTWQTAEYFAREGYMVLVPDLRSWGESDSGTSLFHMGLTADVLNLISSVESLAQADPTKIGLWGHSMGGGIATKVLTIDDRVKAAVLYAPNSADDADLIARWGPGCLPGQSEAQGDKCNPAEIILSDTPADLREAYLAAAIDPEFLQYVAPMYNLNSIQAPMQIHIGTADGQGQAETPPEWSLNLANALADNGQDISSFTYEDQGHFFDGESWVLLHERALTFFNQYLS